MQSILDLLYSLKHINESHHLEIKNKEFDDEINSLDSNEKLEKKFDEVINKLNENIAAFKKKEFLYALCYIKLPLGSITADLWNTEQPLLEVIQKLPDPQPESKPLQSSEFSFLEKLKSALIESTEDHISIKSYTLTKQISLDFRKGDKVVMQDNLIKLYDPTFLFFKAAFNLDGSLNVWATKSILNHIILDKNKFSEIAND